MSDITAQPRPTDASPRFNWRRIIRGQEVGIFLVLVGMILFFSLSTDRFLTPINLTNIMLNFSWTAIAAFGMTMVIISAGIDLSVGSVMALAGIATAMLLARDNSPFAGPDGVVPDTVIPLAVLAGLAVGALCGFTNGLLITVAGLPPFIATLGMLQIARGIVYGWSQGWPVQNLPQNFMILGRQNIPVGSFNFPLPTVIMLIVGIIAWIFLTRTAWGYRIFAVGGNEQAARLSGISVMRTKLMIYTISGLLGGAGGVLLTARLGVAAPTAAQGYELDVIAAVVVGGTSLSGGEGSILGTLIGAAIMGALRTGLNLIGVEAYWLPAAQGIIIIGAITLDQWFRRRQGKSGGFARLFSRGGK
ncbi:MAG: ABC transporter permease [Chloroflexi bacterium]|nr:ABC transporter permease [Chloroflexota bacterium]MDL1884077.1 ABC transporter permease [Anaerolineae bacterium CFX8]